jgi:hypothetical protein
MYIIDNVKESLGSSEIRFIFHSLTHSQFQFQFSNQWAKTKVFCVQLSYLLYSIVIVYIDFHYSLISRFQMGKVSKSPAPAFFNSAENKSFLKVMGI